MLSQSSVDWIDEAMRHNTAHDGEEWLRRRAEYRIRTGHVWPFLTDTIRTVGERFSEVWDRFSEVWDRLREALTDLQPTDRDDEVA